MPILRLKQAFRGALGYQKRSNQVQSIHAHKAKPTLAWLNNDLADLLAHDYNLSLEKRQQNFHQLTGITKQRKIKERHIQLVKKLQSNTWYEVQHKINNKIQSICLKQILYHTQYQKKSYRDFINNCTSALIKLYVRDQQLAQFCICELPRLAELVTKQFMKDYKKIRHKKMPHLPAPPKDVDVYYHFAFCEKHHHSFDGGIKTLSIELKCKENFNFATLTFMITKHSILGYYTPTLQQAIVNLS